MPNEFLGGFEPDPQNPYGSNELNPDLYDGLNQITGEVESIDKAVNMQLRRQINQLQSKIAKLPAAQKGFVLEGYGPGIVGAGGQLTGPTVGIPYQTPANMDTSNPLFDLPPVDPPINFNDPTTYNIPKCKEGETRECYMHLMKKPPLGANCRLIADHGINGVDIACTGMTDAEFNQFYANWLGIGGIMCRCIPKDQPPPDDIKCPPQKCPPCPPVDGPKCPPPVINVTCPPPVIKNEIKCPDVSLVIKELDHINLKCPTPTVVNNNVNNNTCPTPVINITNVIKIPEIEEKEQEECEKKCEDIEDEEEKEKCLQECKPKTAKNHLDWMTSKEGIIQLGKYVDLFGFPQEAIKGDKGFDVLKNLANTFKVLLTHPPKKLY